MNTIYDERLAKKASMFRKAEMARYKELMNTRFHKVYRDKFNKDIRKDKHAGRLDLA